LPLNVNDSRAERDANAEFASSLSYQAGHDTSQPGTTKTERKNTSSRKHAGAKLPWSPLRLDHILE
jgi:hypothetical protein